MIEELEPYKKIQKEGYEGEYRDGLKHGRGVFRYANGNVYEGEFKDGRLNGRGVMNYASGSVYDGQYDDDKRNVYEREWKGKNKKHGRGTMRYANGDVFEGAFMDNNRNGSGVPMVMSMKESIVITSDMVEGSSSMQMVMSTMVSGKITRR